MGQFIKHEAGKPATAKKQPKSTKVATPPSPQPIDLDGVESALERIAHSAKSFNYHSTAGELSLELFTGANSYPLRLCLEGEAVDKIADALSRIAVAMEAKVKG